VGGGGALWHPRPLDRDALHACAAVLPGQHDFTAFTPTDTAHVFFARTVLVARWEEREGGRGSSSPSRPTPFCGA